MNVEIYIHGTPEGHEVYSNASIMDRHVNTYYGAEFDDQSLIIETSIVDCNIYCYYTYFRTNIISYSGRPMHYWGITIRTDCFVKNARVMYQILEMFGQYISSSIMSDGDNRKFLAKSISDIGKKVVGPIANLLSTIILTKDIIKMDDSFLANIGEAIRINPLDLLSVDIVNHVKKAEKLIVSPNVLSIYEKKRLDEYKNKIDFIKHDTEERFREIIHKMETEHQHEVDREKRNIIIAQNEIHELMIRCEEKEQINEKLARECTIHKNEISTLEKQYTDLESSFLPTWEKLAAPLSDIHRFLISKGVIRYTLPELNHLTFELRQIITYLRKEDTNTASKMKGLGKQETDISSKKHRFSKNQILVLVNIVFLFLILCLTLVIFSISVGLFSYPKSELQDSISVIEELHHEQMKEVEPSTHIEDKRVEIIKKETETIKQHDKRNN